MLPESNHSLFRACRQLNYKKVSVNQQTPNFDRFEPSSKLVKMDLVMLQSGY